MPQYPHLQQLIVVQIRFTPRVSSSSTWPSKRAVQDVAAKRVHLLLQAKYWFVHPYHEYLQPRGVLRQTVSDESVRLRRDGLGTDPSFSRYVRVPECV